MIYSRPWTNLILLIAIKMVLCGAVAGDVLTNASRVRRTPRQHHRAPIDEEWKRSHWREMQQIVGHEVRNANGGLDCCPTVREMTRPLGGRTPDGLYVDLYQDGENNMQLYEVSCAPGVVDKPCRFIDARLYNESRCVQKYSYSYALVRYPAAATETPHRHRISFKDGEITVSGGWSLDYVQVRSGCECEIIPTIKPRKRNQHKNKLAQERERHNWHKQGKRMKEPITERRKYEKGDET